MHDNPEPDPRLAEELSQKTARFGALQHVSSVINATLDLGEIYAFVLRVIDDLFGFRHASILLLDEPEETLTVVASRGYEDQPVGGKVPVGTGVIGVVAKRRQIMRVGNLRAKRAYASAVRREMESSGNADKVGEVVPVPGLPDAESQIAIPLLMRDTLIGVLSVESRELTSFDEHDEELIAIVANQAASAIHNARLYQDAERRTEELAEAHERLQRLNETLELRVQERTAELQRTNRELRETHAQLVQSGKMAALGKLVAGIAHEINTPIGAIYSAQNSLKRAVSRLKAILEGGDAPPDVVAIEKSMDAIETTHGVIEAGARDVAEIVKRLRSFARLDEAERQIADIHECLEETLALIQHELRDGVEVVKTYGEIPRVACYPGRLNQVFLNLLYNACQAIEGEGTLSIGTRVVGEEIHVEIRDSGVGISKENLEKVFDPGFTTKGVGVGTGLGLSICYQIIQDHKGRIDVVSEPGRGSAFTVVLPASAKY